MLCSVLPIQYDKISYSVSALSDNIYKLKAKKSANYNNATICNFYTAPPPFRGINLYRDHNGKCFMYSLI